MNYPLHLTFRILALAPQIQIVDEAGQPLMYVKQKLFKLREAVQVFRDDTRSQHLFDIKADRIIDWGAKYEFTGNDGKVVGAVKQSGMRSLFAAHFTIFDANDQPLFEIEQTNPWIGLLDSFLGEVPIVGLFMGYIFNPVYAVSRPGTKQAVMNLVKKRSFLETGFKITKESDITEAEQGVVLLSAIMVTLLERRRS